LQSGVDLAEFQKIPSLEPACWEHSQPSILNFLLRNSSSSNSVFLQNFQGKPIGGATAIKLDGLLKLIETASNERKMSLLHYVVKEAKARGKDSLDFLEEFEILQKVNRYTFPLLLPA
jgi:hypothetical protein